MLHLEKLQLALLRPREKSAAGESWNALKGLGSSVMNGAGAVTQGIGKAVRATGNAIGRATNPPDFAPAGQPGGRPGGTGGISAPTQEQAAQPSMLSGVVHTLNPNMGGPAPGEPLRPSSPPPAAPASAPVAAAPKPTPLPDFAPGEGDALWNKQVADAAAPIPQHSAIAAPAPTVPFTPPTPGTASSDPRMQPGAPLPDFAPGQGAALYDQQVADAKGPLPQHSAIAAPQLAGMMPDMGAFKQLHGGKFDPNSAMDRWKMQQLQQGRGSVGNRDFRQVRLATR